MEIRKIGNISTNNSGNIWDRQVSSNADSSKNLVVLKNRRSNLLYNPNWTALIFAISGFHLGYHLEYIKMLNDAKVASLGLFKGKVC